MAEKDNQSNSQEQQTERKFSKEQYDFLIRCSEKREIIRWNQWREEQILLEGADLLEANLGHADLREAHLENANLSGAHLENANLREAHLGHADLREAHLENAGLYQAHLENANLWRAHLENADLRGANLENAILCAAHLENADLEGARLQDAEFMEANLQDAKLMGANLKNAYFDEVELQGADLSRAIVDGGTLIWRCQVDRNTKFEAVGLDSMRIYPATKQLLEYNIRRMNWEVWYEKHPKLKWLVRPFWLMSDYGRSTKRIVFTFFGLALVFANIYYHWARLAPPGIVENLFVDRNGVDVQWWLVPLRTLYFSIVTQTTLGFGDMYARAQSICGHILLSLQVILGYVLLGALVTRFAVLFTAGGPAGEFTEE